MHFPWPPYWYFITFFSRSWKAIITTCRSAQRKPLKNVENRGEMVPKKQMTPDVRRIIAFLLSWRPPLRYWVAVKKWPINWKLINNCGLAYERIFFSKLVLLSLVLRGVGNEDAILRYLYWRSWLLNILVCFLAKIYYVSDLWMFMFIQTKAILKLSFSLKKYLF